MSISRQKSSQVMNEIGLDLSSKYKTKYFLSDFKKHKGIDRAREIRIEYNMYNQEYCGCKYSYARYLKKKAGEKNDL
jgi:predicted adenine nucleotide alpha hydrolase (AANH) superfamily ATPase